MKIYEILAEGVNDQFLYHGVPDGRTMMQILKSGALEPQEAFEFDSDMDQDNGEEPLDRISLTRNQYLHFPNGQGVAQFVIDKNALRKHGYKVVPKVGAMMNYKDETEEQVYKPIPIKSPFVVEIQYDPDLKIPSGFFDNAKAMGVKVTPWRKQGRSPHVQGDASGPRPQNEYTDPKKLRIGDNGYTSGSKISPATEWYVSYKLPHLLYPDGAYTAISPRSRDKEYIQKLYHQIKDRIVKKLSFDDLLPARQFSKSWGSGHREIHPGEKGWKK
jgi:hypothetical protein